MDCKKPKIAFCIFGVVPRSIKYTYSNMVKNIIDPLKGKLDVDIYVFNINVGKKPVDDVILDQKDCEIINYDYFEEKNEHMIDKETQILCKDMKHVISNEGLDKKTIMNMMRCMYGEYRVGKFLEKNKNKYISAIACCSDYWFLNKIDVKEILFSFTKKNIVFTTIVADGCGYTDGFLFGNIEPLIKILTRYKNLRKNRLIPTHTNYEGLLKNTFIYYKIKREVSKISFFKVRANLKIFKPPLCRIEFYNKFGTEFINGKYDELKKYLDSFSD